MNLVWAPMWSHRVGANTSEIYITPLPVITLRSSNASGEILCLSEEKIAARPVRPMRVGLFGTTLEDALQNFLERYPENVPGNRFDRALKIHRHLFY